MAFSNVVAAVQGIPDGLVSLAVGLVGVTLARWVFVNRQNRGVRNKEAWNETLPLTLVAMLVTGVLIWDQELGVSSSAFAGLGVGWVAVLLLDVVGDRILVAFGGAPRQTSTNPLAEDLDTPTEIADVVYRLENKSQDRADREREQ